MKDDDEEQKAISEIAFHPSGFYTLSGAAMTTDEIRARLEGYPFYAEAALADHHTAPHMSLFEKLGVAAAVRSTIDDMAAKLTEPQLAFVRVLILFAERQERVRMAGVLAGMNAKARQEWIEANSRYAP